MQQNRSFFLPISFFMRVGFVIFVATLFIRPLYYYLTEGFSLKRVEVTIDHDPASNLGLSNQPSFSFFLLSPPDIL